MLDGKELDIDEMQSIKSHVDAVYDQQIRKMEPCDVSEIIGKICDFEEGQGENPFCIPQINLPKIEMPKIEIPLPWRK